VSYETQLQLKHEWVEQALRRIAKSDVEVLPVQGTNAQWNYRRVVKLRFGADLKLSYVNASSNGLTPVESCSIFSEDAQLWKELNAFVGSLFKDTRISSGVVSLFRASAEKLVALVEIDDVKTPQFSLPSVLQGCIIKTPRKTLSVGDVTLSFVQHGLEFVYTPLSFVQSHPEQSAKLSQQVIDEVVSSGAKSVFDLYSGFGISAIALAKDGLRVTGVESNPESIRLAKLNAQTNDVQVDWVCDDVASFLRASKHQSPDVIIVNPPRTGLDAKVTEMLAKSKAHKIIYVSCMPQTLARDLAILSKSGYNVDSCQPYDMFPQTTHVETVAVLNITR
jgi:23S rRNA (uracil1939-C5)-methyltransferase